VKLPIKSLCCEPAMEGQVRLFWVDRLRQFVDLGNAGKSRSSGRCGPFLSFGTGKAVSHVERRAPFGGTPSSDLILARIIASCLG
jgi:hypothetical protein